MLDDENTVYKLIGPLLVKQVSVSCCGSSCSKRCFIVALLWLDQQQHVQQA